LDTQASLEVQTAVITLNKAIREAAERGLEVKVEVDKRAPFGKKGYEISNEEWFPYVVAKVSKEIG